MKERIERADTHSEGSSRVVGGRSDRISGQMLLVGAVADAERGGFVVARTQLDLCLPHGVPHLHRAHQGGREIDDFALATNHLACAPPVRMRIRFGLDLNVRGGG